MTHRLARPHIRPLTLCISFAFVLACGDDEGDGKKTSDQGQIDEPGRDADGGIALNINGLWTSTDLACGDAKRRETVRIEQEDTAISATMVSGNECLPAGYVTFKGSLPRAEVTVDELPISFDVELYGGKPGDTSSIAVVAEARATIVSENSLQLELEDEEETLRFARQSDAVPTFPNAGAGGAAAGSGGARAGSGGRSGSGGSASAGRGGAGGAGGAAGAEAEAGEGGSEAGRGGSGGSASAGRGGAGGAGGAAGRPAAGSGGRDGAGGRGGSGGSGAGGAGSGGAGSGGAAGGGGAGSGGAAGGGGAGSGGAAGGGGAGAAGAAASGAAGAGGMSSEAGAGGAAADCTGPILPGASCDHVEQCGCEDGENCRFGGDDPPQCFPAGPNDRLEACESSEDCSVGLVCAGGACQRMCRDDEDCGEDGTCSGSDEGVEGLAYCVSGCDPVLPLACYDAFPSGESCLPCGSDSSLCVPNAQRAVCTPATLQPPRGLDAPCTTTAECFGAGCYQEVCRKWCRRDSECPTFFERCVTTVNWNAGPGDPIGVCAPR